MISRMLQARNKISNSQSGFENGMLSSPEVVKWARGSVNFCTAVTDEKESVFGNAE